MKVIKRYIWSLPLVALAVAGFGLFSLSRSAAQVGNSRNSKVSGVAAQSSQSGKKPTPPCSGQWGITAVARLGGYTEDAECNRGFSSITHPATGIYCLTLAFPPPPSRSTTALVSVEWGASYGVANFAQWNADNGNCGGSSQKTIEVQTYKGDAAGVGSDLQVPVLSDLVAFVVYVP